MNKVYNLEARSPYWHQLLIGHLLLIFKLDLLFYSCIKFITQSCLMNENPRSIWRFTSCLNMGFDLTILKISLDIIQEKALLPGPIITATFLFAKMLLAL